MKKAFKLFSAALSKVFNDFVPYSHQVFNDFVPFGHQVHRTFFTLAVLCAVAMMAGCKGRAATNDTIAIDTKPDCTSLFDGLQYNDEGIAFIKDITIEVNGGGRYDFDKDAPVYAGKWGCTAVGFDYCDEHYYIPVDENIDIAFPEEFPSTACVTIQVWRDYAEYRYYDTVKTECGPFALITSYQLK